MSASAVIRQGHLRRRALPGEAIKARIIDDKKHYAHAALQQVVTPAANRVAPLRPLSRVWRLQCPAPGRGRSTGGQEAGLVSLFERLGNIQAPALAPALTGESRAYRRVCRLAIKFDKNGRCTRVGFRRRQSNDLVEIAGCPVLAEPLSAPYRPLRECLNRLKSQRELGHAELIPGGAGHSDAAAPHRSPHRGGSGALD